MIAAADCRVAEHEGDRQLDEGDPGLVGQLGERLGGVELALVLGQGQVEPVGESLAGRRRRPGLFVLAVAADSQPPASGL